MKRDPSITWNPNSSADASKLNVLVVGGTGGLGRAISRDLDAKGAQVTVVGQTFRDSDRSAIKFIKADLSLMREVQRVAEELTPSSYDLVVFTTGIFAAPQRQQTSEGLERDMAVSYLNRLLLTNIIVPKMEGQAGPLGKPRLVFMGYPGSGQLGDPADLNATKAYKAMSAHMNTVAGNEALVLDAARRYPHLNVIGLNPGLVKTSIRDNFFGKGSVKSTLMETIIGWLTPTPEKYAERIVPLLISTDIDRHSGALFNNKGQAILPSDGMTDAYAAAYVKASDELLATATTKTY